MQVKADERSKLNAMKVVVQTIELMPIVWRADLSLTKSVKQIKW